ncbi:MAG TPA: 3-phosphoserine/phosphohydroxythreonine transaminase [Saprospiraceae bacterium]|jgi:phosphoserine aminotransferase|nr:3-phosphoserine/phosphohydroxythreonine transaminase [Saprospiraceae bacterium]HRO09518.1 3-phosphoserine/phosphohydroxythreonine transaminase [Saprospiraceae bacterium]HRP42785.1 3-phosphoserine/phosphohydroxythreonine transaminase [Saprospiraceae bacterium]
MKYNFYAGPAILPHEVIEASASAVLDFEGTGLSLLEISHRSKEFVSVMDEAISLVKSLLNINDDYAVIFLGGGASTQFSMVPINLLHAGRKAAYVDTGTWASKAIKDGKVYGDIEVIASSKDKNYSYIPKEFQINPDFQYLHLTSNNTIYGTQYKEFPVTDVPIVCDMSSDIFSRPIDINRFDLIYAGAQKNLGPAGTTLVIVKKSALTKSSGSIGAMLDYNNHINGASMYNTPPVFPVFVSMLTLRWLVKNGGIEAIQRKNDAKSSLLYAELDRNSLFYNSISREDRSDMNVSFHLYNTELDDVFLTRCKEAGCIGLAGHRSVGGFRTSIYNAMSIEGVQVLTEVMKDFEDSHG